MRGWSSPRIGAGARGDPSLLRAQPPVPPGCGTHCAECRWLGSAAPASAERWFLGGCGQLGDAGVTPLSPVEP